MALQGLQTALKKAIVDLNQAAKRPPGRPLPVAPKGNSAVAKLIATHETFQTKAAAGNGVALLQAKVERLRTWLQRQNCVVGVDGTIDWQLSSRTVEYDHELVKQGMTRVRILAGRLFLDDAGTTPLDTSNMVTHFSGPGNAIFVMGKSGNIHVSSHSVGHRHHSSLLAGRKVSGAGELKCTNGWITWLSNKSGHYAPSVVHLLQILHQLQKNNVPMTFGLTVMPEKTQYTNVGAFLKYLDLNDQPDYELMKLLAYSSHLTDELLATHHPDPWRWRNAAAGERAAVYSISTNSPVQHKIVRQWLKSQGKFPTREVQPGDGR